MGWASGSYLAEAIWRKLKFDNEETKKIFAKVIYEEFCNHDADDWDFVKGSLYWTYLKFYEPEEFKEYTEEQEMDGE